MQTMAFESSNNTNPFDKYTNMFVKFVVCFLFLGALYRFYFLTPFPPVLDSDTDSLRDSPWFPVAGSPETSHLPGDYSHCEYFYICFPLLCCYM